MRHFFRSVKMTHQLPDTCQRRLNTRQCIVIPERPPSLARDPLNGSIPSAHIDVRVLRSTKRSCKPTIVFIHGFVENLTSWDCAQLAVSRCYPTLALDLRGFGNSSKTPATLPGTLPAPGQINYTLQVFADDLRAVLTALGLTNNLILVGHSIGVSIALNYIVTYGGVVKFVSVSGTPLIAVNCSAPLPPCVQTVSPILNCSSCPANPSDTLNCCSLFPANPTVANPLCCVYPQSVAYLETVLVETLTCFGSCPDESCQVNCILNNIIKPSFMNEPCTNPAFLTLQENFAAFILPQATNPVTVGILTSTLLVASTQDQRHLVSQIHIPTLICVGSIDANVDPRNGTYMYQRIDNSILVDFMGKGHFLHITDATHFNKVLRSFLRKKLVPGSTSQLPGSNPCAVCSTSFAVANFTVCGSENI
jgi:pimeloyl-ACP methyl ester carboxylesterase